VRVISMACAGAGGKSLHLAGVDVQELKEKSLSMDCGVCGNSANLMLPSGEIGVSIIERKFEGSKTICKRTQRDIADRTS